MLTMRTQKLTTHCFVFENLAVFLLQWNYFYKLEVFAMTDIFKQSLAILITVIVLLEIVTGFNVWNDLHELEYFSVIIIIIIEHN